MYINIFVKNFVCEKNGIAKHCWEKALREKSSNMEFFLVHIFLYLDWIQENTDPEELHIWTLFT